MEKSNLIISIIIVVCIAAGVAAYGITNSDNVIFSELSGVDSNSGSNGLGTGNNSSAITANSGSGSSSGSSSGTGSGSSSGRGSGSGSGGGGSGGGGGSTPTSKITPQRAQQIAAGAITQEGCHAGTAQDTGSYYVVPVLDAEGNNVGEIDVSYSGKIIGGGGGAPE